MNIFLRLVTTLFMVAVFCNLAAVNVLFDYTKDQTAGNADWVIGSSPNWRGAFSDFGQNLRDQGHNTSTLTGSTITSSALSGCDVFVIPEPQDPFSSSERTAIINFVNAGGGLYLIADHGGADRNNNGWDAVRVFNQSLQCQSNFGFSFNDDSNWAEPTTAIESPRTDITNGVNRVGAWAGSSINTTSGVQEHVWLDSYHQDAYVVSTTLGQGRVVAIGDSSPLDDGTGNSGNNLYDGYNVYDCAALSVNIVNWLAQGNSQPLAFASVGQNPQTVQAGQSVQVSIQTVGSPTQVVLNWRTTGAFNAVNCTAMASDEWVVTIPGLPQGITVSWYMQAYGSGSAVYPEGAPEQVQSYTIEPITATSDNHAPTATSGLNIYPCPFSPANGSLRVNSINGNPQTVSVYALDGRKVKSFTTPALWNGLDNNNKPLPAGIYLVKGKTAAVHKLLMLK